VPLGQEVPLGPPVGIICCADAGLVSSTREKVRAAPTKTPREGLIVAFKRGTSQSYHWDAGGRYWRLIGARAGKWNHYQTKHNEADAYRVAKNRANQTGKRHRLVNESGSLLDPVEPD